MSTRFTSFLKGAEERLRADSKAIGDALDHHGEIGMGREDSLRRELRLLLPSAYQVTSGFVIGAQTGISKQQDVLIHDSMHYPAATYGDQRQLLVPESVYASISVRSRITPSDMEDRFREAFDLKELLRTALGKDWPGFCCLFAFGFEGNWATLKAKFFEMVADRPRKGRLDLLCVLDQPLLLDAHSFGLADERRKGFGGMAGTIEFFIPKDPRTKHNDMCVIEPADGAFSGFYQLVLTRLSNTALLPLRSLTLPRFVQEASRVEDVFEMQIQAPTGTRLGADHEMVTTCPTCGTRQTLGEAVITQDGDDTVYSCRNGCQPLVIVSRPADGAPWPGRGYRMGDHVIRNAADLYYPVVGTGSGLVLPASPAALMKQRPTS
jgi:hypothetical protein